MTKEDLLKSNELYRMENDKYLRAFLAIKNLVADIGNDFRMGLFSADDKDGRNYGIAVALDAIGEIMNECLGTKLRPILRENCCRVIKLEKRNNDDKK